VFEMKFAGSFLTMEGCFATKHRLFKRFLSPKVKSYRKEPYIIIPSQDDTMTKCLFWGDTYEKSLDADSTYPAHGLFGKGYYKT
jgi:hypothetical protein